MAAALVSADRSAFQPRKPRRGGSVFAVGRAFAVEILDLDRPTAGPDLGRNGCQNCVQARRIKTSRGSLLAFSRPTQHHAQFVRCKQPNGSEQMWRERAAAGYDERESKGMLDPARLVFIDETAVSTNMVRLERWRAFRVARVRGDWLQSGRFPLGRAGDDHLRGRSASQ